MSYEPLTLNTQYAIGGADYFPNKSKRYNVLTINRKKAKRGQRETRKVEAITGREGAIRRKLNSKNKETKRVYQKAVGNILSHFYDQSILASEKGHFPSLPKESVVDVPVPPKGLSSRVKKLGPPSASATHSSLLYNSFVPTNYSKFVDLTLTTPPLLIPGREQPYGGTEGSPEQLQIPRFIPNPSYGGSKVRYN
jgi:hypothetical protein